MVVGMSWSRLQKVATHARFCRGIREHDEAWLDHDATAKMLPSSQNKNQIDVLCDGRLRIKVFQRILLVKVLMLNP